MKRYYLALALLIYSLMYSYSQDNSHTRDETKNTRKNLIKLNYLVLPAKAVNLSYERVLGNYLSFQFQGYYVFGTFGYFDVSYSNWYGITPEIRVYITGKAPKGLFVAPYYNFHQNYQRISRDYPPMRYRYNLNAAGLCAGYQWKLGGHFTIDLYGGGGIQHWATNRPTDLGSVSGTERILRFGSTFGFRF